MMRTAAVVILIAVASCHYAGPLAGGRSEIREGTFPDRVARILFEAGGARAPDVMLPPSALDSAAIYLLVVDQDASGLATAAVAVLPHSDSTSKYPRDGWLPVDAFGVYSQRFAPGEYFVFVQDRYHWSARKLVQLSANSIDTLLAVMRSGVQQGDWTFQPFSP
jgi:hypothetical protein